MIIKLLESKLFTVDPAVRFAKEYNVSPKLWNEIWKRYTLMQYDYDGICGYFQYKTGRKPNVKSFRRWILRTELYCRAQHIILMGVRVVDSSYFREFEQPLLLELTRSMRFSGEKNSRSIL